MNLPIKLSTIPRVLLLMGVLGLFLSTINNVNAAEKKHGVFLQFDGLINIHTANLIARGFDKAESENAKLLVLSLNTPGGELEATRQIVSEFLESSVPSVVYVSPQGARAGSAGTFITAAANFAVMAPGTNIGAASPVTITGGDLPDTLGIKITNDAASLIRSIAETRGRNADRLEDMVRLGIANTAVEAVESGIVDFLAEDVEDLLQKLDGRLVKTSEGDYELNTKDLELDEVTMTTLEKFLQLLANPTLAFFLLILGGIGITLELFSPGMLFGIVLGSIFLILSFLGLGSLPVNWAGVIFILLAFILFIVEVQVVGFGILGIGAILAFLLGSFLLLMGFLDNSVWQGPLDLNIIPIAVLLIVICGATGFYMYTLVKSSKDKYPQHRLDPITGKQLEMKEGLHYLVGRQGYVITVLNPVGVVTIGSESWSARSTKGTSIPKGSAVSVQSVEGAVLYVDTIDSIR